MNKKTIVTPIIAVICITILEVVAMFQGIDGYLHSLALAAIAAIAGVTIPFRAKKVE